MQPLIALTALSLASLAGIAEAQPAHLGNLFSDHRPDAGAAQQAHILRSQSVAVDFQLLDLVQSGVI